MNRIHQKLLERSPHYHRWHQHPRHPFWHWVFFSFAAILIFNHLSIRIGDYSNEEMLSISIQTSQTQAAGNTYYVATTGSDARSCSTAANINTPKRTIASSLTCLSPGSTLYIRGGTYNESDEEQMPSGTSSQWITVAAYPSETVIIAGWPAHFSGPPSGAQYIILDGLKFTNGLYMGGYWGNPPPGSNIIVRNFEVSGGIQNSITLAGNNITFSNGKVHDNVGSACIASHGSARYCHGFYIEGASNITIENLEVYNITGVAIKIGEEALTTNVIVRNNVIHDWAQADRASAILFASDSANSAAYNNVIYNCTGRDTTGNDPGIDAIEFWSGENNAAYNNTINISGGNCEAGIRIYYGTNSTIRNNIVIGGSSNLLDYGGLSATYTLSNNFCNVSGFGCSVVGNPLFVNAAAGDFHLLSTSPARDAGATLGSPYNVDFDGVSRPQGSAYDIGAYEYGGTATPTPTPTPTTGGETYYVSTTGNDANSCTQAQSISTPKRTIKNGISCLTPGDTLYIRAGTYPEDMNINSITIPFGTSWFNATTIAGYPGEQVILNPSGCTIINFPQSAQYLILDNMILDGANLTVSASNACVPISLSGNDPITVNHLRFKNLEIKNSPWNGLIGGGSYIEMLNLKVHNNGTKTFNSGNGIYGTMDNSIVDGGEYYNNAGYGVRMFDSAMTSSADNNIIRNIRTYNNESGGIVLSDYNNTAYNNLVYGNTFGSGIDVGSGNISGNIKLYNNVIYNNAGYAINIFSFDGPSYIQNTQVRNNIIFANGVNTVNNEGTGTIVSNNLFIDPKFVNAMSNDFHLQSTSPAINTGATLVSPYNIDKDGLSRPQGCCYDIGAYEYGGVAGIPTPTPTPTPTPSFFSCDLNQDSQTNILDFQLLANVILGITANPGGADINKDGQTNILDTQVLANVILGKTTCP